MDASIFEPVWLCAAGPDKKNITVRRRCHDPVCTARHRAIDEELPARGKARPVAAFIGQRTGD